VEPFTKDQHNAGLLDVRVFITAALLFSDFDHYYIYFW